MTHEVEIANKNAKTELQSPKARDQLDFRLIEGVDFIPGNSHKPSPKPLELGIPLHLNIAPSSNDNGSWLD